MPHIKIFISPADTATETQACLAEGTTHLMVDILRKRREVTVVQVLPTPAGQWFAGGQRLTDTARAAYTEVQITQGSNSAEEKARFLREFHALLEATLGPLHAPAYTVIHEVPGGDWGYDGLSQAQRAGRL